jgi:hypothetical protein
MERIKHLVGGDSCELSLTGAALGLFYACVGLDRHYCYRMATSRADTRSMVEFGIRERYRWRYAQPHALAFGPRSSCLLSTTSVRGVRSCIRSSWLAACPKTKTAIMSSWSDIFLHLEFPIVYFEHIYQSTWFRRELRSNKTPQSRLLLYFTCALHVQQCLRNCIHQ